MPLFVDSRIDEIVAYLTVIESIGNRQFLIIHFQKSTSFGIPQEGLLGP